MAAPTSPRCPATQMRRPLSSKCRLPASSAESTFIAPPFMPYLDQIGFDHLTNQLLKTDLVPPAQLCPGLGGIAEQVVDLGRPVIAGVDPHQHVAGHDIACELLRAGALPRNFAADMPERDLDELAHRMGLARCEHIVVGCVLLQDQPHPFDVVACMAPVA